MAPIWVFGMCLNMFYLGTRANVKEEASFWKQPVGAQEEYQREGKASLPECPNNTAHDTSVLAGLGITFWNDHSLTEFVDVRPIPSFKSDSLQENPNIA